jgi:hypothetical protein
MSRGVISATCAHPHTTHTDVASTVHWSTHNPARNCCYERYHVKLGRKRTTISVDKTLSTLMSLHLNTQPNTPSAHLAVRTWLQARLDQNNDPGRTRTSQWLHGELVVALIGPALKQKYDAWIDSELDRRLSSSHSRI